MRSLSPMNDLDRQLLALLGGREKRVVDDDDISAGARIRGHGKESESVVAPPEELFRFRAVPVDNGLCRQ